MNLSGKISGWFYKTKKGIDYFLMDNWGFSAKQVHLSWHYMSLLRDQVLAIIPITLLQVHFSNSLQTC